MTQRPLWVCAATIIVAALTQAQRASAQAIRCASGLLPVRSLVQTDEHACIDPSQFVDAGEVSYAWDTEFELDEFSYFIRLLYRFQQAFPRFQVDQEMIEDAVETILDVVETEQNHMAQSPYRRWELGNEGLGTPVLDGVGLVWTGARASDDKSEQHYHVPDNFFLAQAMVYLQRMFRPSTAIHRRAAALRAQILAGIAQRGLGALDDGRPAFAYEVNGYLPDSANYAAVFIDDANIPSLLSLPYIAPDVLSYSVNGVTFAQIYQNTREFVLGRATIGGQPNPYYFSGTAASGIGSPHTGTDLVWPLGMMTQGLTAQSVTEAQGVLRSLLGVTCELNSTGPASASSGYFHESFSKNDPCDFTRAYFGWPNTLFTEFVDRFDWSAKPSYLADLPPSRRRGPGSTPIPLPADIDQFTLSTYYTQDFHLSLAYTQNFDESQPDARDTRCRKVFGGYERPCRMTLMNTGDIIAMWTRDSAAQVNNYIGQGSDLSAMVEQVLFMQAFQIANTPYANAYSFTYGPLYRCNQPECTLFTPRVPVNSPPGFPTTVPMGGIVQDISLIR